MTSVAVNAVTTQQHAVAARGAASAAAGDPFAAVLDEIVQDAGNDNASDTTRNVSDAVGAAAAPNDPSQALPPGKKLPTDRLKDSDPATVPPLALLPPQQDTATPVVAANVPAAQDDDADAATLTVPVADASGARAAAPTDTPPKASGGTVVRHSHRDSGSHTHQAASDSEDANLLSVAANVPAAQDDDADATTQVDTANVAAVRDGDVDAVALTVPVADAPGVRAAAPTGTSPKASGDTVARHAQRDSRSHTHPAANDTDNANTLSLAASQVAAEIALGATPPVVSTDTSAPASNTVPKVAAPAAAAATPVGAADVVPTDIVASAMLPSGAIIMPAATATATRPQGDSTKTQIRQSAAAALADASKAVGHVFSDPRAGNAAPAHVAVSDPTPHAPTASGTSTPVPPDSPVQQPAATPAPPAAPHLQAPPQPSTTMPTAAPPVAIVPAAPAAGSAVSAQLQIGHAQPDTGALAFTIAAKSADGARHFDIRLDPAELGRVDVRLTVDDAGKAQATLSVEKPQTLALLQKDQPQLERALRDAGLDLSQNGLNFSLRGQQQQSANSGGNAPGRSRALAARVIAAVDSAASTVSLGQMSPGDTRLDIKV